MVGGINGLYGGEEIPSSWRVGNMKMIEKCKRPSPGDFRPITVTSIGYRLFLGG